MAGKEEQYKLTNCGDEERVNFLFSAFPTDRNVNPKHWNSKMTYWQDQVRECCMFYDDICVNCEKLRSTFRRGNRTPLGKKIVRNFDHR